MTKVKATPCDASSIHLLILLNSFIVVVEEAFGNQRILIVSLFFFFNILVLCESHRFDGFVHPFHDSMPIPLSALINLFLLLSFFLFPALIYTLAIICTAQMRITDFTNWHCFSNIPLSPHSLFD